MSRRDHYGLTRWFYHRRGEQQAATLRELFANPTVPCRLDPNGVQAHLGLRPLDAETTCFADVRAVRSGGILHHIKGRWCQILAPQMDPGGKLLGHLAAAVEEMLTPGTALALGGGLDSALLLAVIRRELGRAVPVYSLIPDIPGYSERDAILQTARGLGAEVELLNAGERDLVEGLADSVRFAEVPLYNLHPVSKLLLARKLKERGIRRVITGDGADQVFAGVPGWDYLPIVGAVFAGEGVELCCPFLHERVAGWGAERADPAKSQLRKLGGRLLPASVAEAPKVPQLAPEMDLTGVAGPQELSRAWRALGKTGPSEKPDIRAVSLALLFRHFPRLCE